MRLFVTCDADIQSGLSEVLLGVNAAFEHYFSDRFYDDSGINISIILMCRDPRWTFKQRIRFSKQENKLYLDIMLDWYEMTNSDKDTRKRIVAERIITEVPEIIARKRFKDFDLSRFTSDLREWFEMHGWIDSDFPEIID